MLKTHRRNWLFLLGFVLAAAGGLVLASCAGTGSSGGGTNVSYGDNVQGMYQVLVQTTQDTCPDGALTSVTWSLTVEQNADYSVANVYYQETGAGTKMEMLFTGQVYGTLIILNDVQKNPAGNADCIQLQIESYHLDVDPTASSVSGWLSDEIVYVGDNCSPSTVSCSTQRTVQSVTPPVDDDASPDDDDDSSPA
jgi:hypothetical protein